MNKFGIFTIEYFVVLVVFIIFNYVAFLDSIIFIIYILSSIYYVFAFQVLPSSKVKETPSVQYYRESRINTYGYAMSGVLIISSLLFFTLNIVFAVRTGLVTVVIWPITLFLIYFLSSRTQKDLFEKIVAEFITKNIEENHEKILEMVKFLVNKLKLKDYTEIQLVNLLESSFKVTNVFAKSFVDLFVGYIDEIKDLSSDEIETLNELNR